MRCHFFSFFNARTIKFIFGQFQSKISSFPHFLAIFSIFFSTFAQKVGPGPTGPRLASPLRGDLPGQTAQLVNRTFNLESGCPKFESRFVKFFRIFISTYLSIFFLSPTPSDRTFTWCERKKESFSVTIFLYLPSHSPLHSFPIMPVATVNDKCAIVPQHDLK